MKTFILVVIMSGHPPGVYFTQHCDQHMRAINEAMPHADTYCLEPGYVMRPVARGGLS